jgi:uncharacterized protein
LYQGNALKMRNEILVDSNFLYALNDVRDKYHRRAIVFATNNRQKRIVPDVVLVEVAQLLRDRVRQFAVLDFLDSLDSPLLRLEPVTLVDTRRAREIMAFYDRAKLDMVDCCIIALAERLDTTQICTFDRRDYAMFRPKHVDFLELLP